MWPTKRQLFQSVSQMRALPEIMSVLTQQKLKGVLVYYPDTGDFYWRIVTRSRIPQGTKAGSCSNGYTIIKIDGTSYPAHRLAWLYMTGSWPDDQIDHRDCIRNNNRWSNLRLATHAENQQNRQSAQSNNKSGYLGVCFDKPKSKWRANVRVDGKLKHVGYYDSPEAAHKAYVKAKRRLHPFCEL